MGTLFALSVVRAHLQPSPAYLAAERRRKGWDLWKISLITAHPSVLMPASDVFVRGVHHRHSKQATSLQCWKENCQLKNPPTNLSGGVLSEVI